MKVVIAGGHGKIGLHVERLLAERGDHPIGLIRDAAQEADVIAAGAHPVVIDLENTTAEELSAHLSGVDAVLFAAGAGPGSSAERKDSVDRAAAALLADAATLAGVRRYVLVSSIGSDAGAQPDHDPVFAAYITAKKAADDDLRTRDLDWTVVRPGALTDSPGSGHVTLTTRVGRGSVSREDVAAVLVAVLDAPGTAGLSLDLVSGRHPIADAVAGAAALVAAEAEAADAAAVEAEAVAVAEEAAAAEAAAADALDQATADVPAADGISADGVPADHLPVADAADPARG